jgi:hypothetical protein
MSRRGLGFVKARKSWGSNILLTKDSAATLLRSKALSIRQGEEAMVVHGGDMFLVRSWDSLVRMQAVHARAFRFK